MDCFEQSTTIIGLFIQFFVAIGTIGLALFAFMQIREVNNTNKRRQLYEILNWVNSVLQWDYYPNFQESKKLPIREQWSELTMFFTIRADTLRGSLCNGYIIQKSSLHIKNSAITIKIAALLKEMIITYNKIEKLRDHTHEALVVNSQRITKEFEVGTNELLSQINKQKEAAETLITELGEIIY